jgi:hypothetical protein
MTAERTLGPNVQERSRRGCCALAVPRAPTAKHDAEERHERPYNSLSGEAEFALGFTTHVAPLSCSTRVLDRSPSGLMEYPAAVHDWAVLQKALKSSFSDDVLLALGVILQTPPAQVSTSVPWELMLPESPTATHQAELVHETPYSSFSGDAVFGLRVRVHEAPANDSINVRDCMAFGPVANPTATQW